MRFSEEQLGRALRDLAEREVLTAAPTRQVVDRARRAARRRPWPPALFAGHAGIRRPGSRWVYWSAAATGMVASVAVAMVLVSSLAGTPASPGAAVPAAPTGQQILLAAAEQAERAPATTGRFWVVKETISVRFLVDAGYQVTNRRIQEEWKAVRPGDASWVGLWDQGTKPSTPADEAAWRADGSPAQWRGSLRLSTAAKEPNLTKLSGGSGNDYFGESEVSLAEIRALPADPDALKKWGERRIVRQSTMTTDTEVHFVTALTLLTSTPAAPAVRAAAFRLLASLPGVRSEGEARDDSGREGTLIVVADGDRRSEIIVDAAEGQVLASKGIGEPTNSCAGRSQEPSRCRGMVAGVIDSTFTVGWSDGPPTPPTIR